MRSIGRSSRSSPQTPTPLDVAIASHVAERIPDGATLQVGIGAIPNAILALLHGHQHLGVHTELLSDGVIDLVEAGAVTGVAKTVNRTKVVATFVLGTRRAYDFVHDNASVELWPVERVNDAREIGRERPVLFDQRNPRGRPVRPVCIGDARRPLLVGVRWPGRFRPGRDVLAGGAGVRRAAVDGEGWGSEPHRLADSGRVRS